MLQQHGFCTDFSVNRLASGSGSNLIYHTDLDEDASPQSTNNGYQIIQAAGSPIPRTRTQTQDGVTVTLASTRKIDRTVGRMLSNPSLYDSTGIVIVGGTILQILRHEERFRIHANWGGVEQNNPGIYDDLLIIQCGWAETLYWATHLLVNWNDEEGIWSPQSRSCTLKGYDLLVIDET